MSAQVDIESGNLISVHLSREDRTEEVHSDGIGTLMDLVKLLGLPPDGVVILNDGIPQPLDKMINGKVKKLTVINVASGG